MSKQTVSRIEKALRHNRREKPKIALFWRYMDADGRHMVRTPEGDFEQSAFERYYAPVLREQGRVIVLDWLDQNKKS